MSKFWRDARCRCGHRKGEHLYEYDIPLDVHGEPIELRLNPRWSCIEGCACREYDEAEPEIPCDAIPA